MAETATEAEVVTSTELTIPERPQMSGYRPTGREEFEVQTDLAKVIFASGLVPDHIKNWQGVQFMFQVARDLGINTTQTLQQVYVSRGTPAIRAELMRSLILGGGHHFEITEKADDHCTIEYRRRGFNKVRTFTYSLAKAKKAGLTTGKNATNWESRPDDMLQARATTAVARMAFPDVIAGMSSREELEDSGDFQESTPSSSGQSSTPSIEQVGQAESSKPEPSNGKPGAGLTAAARKMLITKIQQQAYVISSSLEEDPQSVMDRIKAEVGMSIGTSGQYPSGEDVADRFIQPMLDIATKWAGEALEKVEKEKKEQEAAV